MPRYQGISLLITHYNRSHSLERLLTKMAELDMQFEAIVVSDDGSKPEHLDYVRELATRYFFKLVTTPQNRGLGNNINKGQDAITTPYTLYIQEDFIPLPAFTERLQQGFSFMEADKSIDLVRFYGYFPPLVRPYKDGFSEMYFTLNPFSKGGYAKFYAYSDHPHLKRSSFPEKFGRYREGIKAERTEYRMMISFLQHKGKGLFYNDFQGLLEQYNPTDEPSTIRRGYWRNTGNWAVSFTREVYRHVRFHFDYLFS
ncbi:glycosyltransferase [Filimonas effusa]|uniref:Glycosyltransferase family 2 protein n=1 Tax=Filimonas effusa TaxID=2508721 RepID=A0A4Q1D1Q3_9BACT|nr:glycosyltransferase [Filimonas effusa]RXK81808.1 glycosyltransferase family 2 protein [Filimonas effusa]